MRRIRNMRTALVCGIALFSAMLVVGQSKQAEARPQYRTQFKKTYPDLAKKQGKAVNCLVCHEKKDDGKPDNKKRNIYGKALTKAVGKKNQKDKKKIEEALKKTEKEKSAIKDMTFGDLIKAGKLPASSE